MLSQARAILRHSTEMAQDVLTRGLHFDEALKQVQGETRSRKAHDAQMATLHNWAPEVAALVTDGRLTLDEGMQQLGALQKAVRQRIEHGKSSADHIATIAGHVMTVIAVMRLTDRELAMVGCDRRDTDPMANLSRPEVVQALRSLERLIAVQDGMLPEEDAP